ncbi:MAG: tRNA (N(6)-L-threonylcarbamoyladenosine(37)-C(2))-methylthiotransferase MtaB [Muribaculaceae bacterium]|nr:tRNA (N(6)-L-threonylcarbamoyladenosine(37)-C(2))-methylthiotransferase MtaB [Muribaculaceae bacterium]
MTDHSISGIATALFHTFGCKLNFAETSTVANMFRQRGIRRVAEGETPDLIVINSCSVTDLADKKCRQAIRSFAKRYPDAPIIVTGCYAQLKPGEIAAIDGVAIVAGSDQKQNLADFLDKWTEQRNQQLVVTPSREITEFTPSCSRGDRTRYFLKVQDGCDYWCTYCTIPIARGRSRSGSIQSMVDQVNQVVKDGGREVVITGVNIGDFGKGTDKNFLDLIKELDQIDGIDRYRISSIEPNLLSEEIIDFVANSRRFMPHFHVPLQAGSDTVLKLMHRHYDTAHFRHKMELIKQAMPDAFIGVDLMVGTRGETLEEFEKSRDFVESLDISRLHVFPYSERPGTRALSIDHVVDQAEKHRRTAVMIELSDKKLTEFTSRFINTIRPVLLEHGSTPGILSGFTDNYLKVRVPADNSLDNSIVNVELKSYNPKAEESKGIIVS